MDIESDDSERWEDFFGSSTDLAPSLLGIYDSLTTVLDSAASSNISSTKESLIYDCDSHNGSIVVDAEPNRPSTASYLSKLQSYVKSAELKAVPVETDVLSQTSNTPSNSGSCSSSIRGSLESVASTNGHTNKHRSNIRILSPNVQRIITHSDAVDIEALQSSSRTGSDTQHRLNKKKPIVPSNQQKMKFSHLPLSKTTGKITQSGTDFVETFNTGLNEDYQRNDVKSKVLRKPATPAIYPIPGIDDDKTPTNATAFSFDTTHCERLHSSRKLSLPKGTLLNDSLTNEPSLEAIVSGISLGCVSGHGHTTETINLEVVSDNLKNLNLADGNLPAITEDKKLNDAVNKPLISKYLTRNAPTPPLTYARSKSLAARDFAQQDIELKKAASISRSMLLPDTELDENQISAERLDRLSDIKSKFSPKESRKVSCLTLPDIAKLKHRPLSSSSICSTSSSSSSSSGAEHMNCKLNTSYLASVESLADHSENELTETHAGMSVFERACMEIVDSERNYVNDLGEVIRGYLSDWKERACLRQDDLLLLFSNIEDVYHFNQYLLKHLSESILDPIKIAKCFIDLKEGFDVYTTYCTSYPEAISLLTKLLQATHTNALLASTQRMLHHTLPLGSYLLKPVQRILKYHLLLDNLRKHCDIKEVMQAYEIMRQVARNIDQVKRKLEQQTRVKELCGILDGWLGPELTVLGELRLEGVLMENNKPRKVLLFATMLITAKAKEDNRLQFKSYIHQNNLMLSEHLAGEPTSFYVIPYDEPRHQIKLTAKNREQKRLWTQHIKSVILEKFDNIPLRAKELVYQLGDEEDRTTDKSPWKWGLHSASTPTYLERRNQFRRSEMRNRSKVKRKTISNTMSIDVFNESSTKESNNILKSISKSAESIHDKSLTSLEPGGDEMVGICEKMKCIKEKKCMCLTFGDDNEHRDSFKATRQSYKTFRFGSKPLKERSKSVPRICMKLDNLEKATLEAIEVKASKCEVVCATNSKTLPKRMTSSMKRQKSKAKETSTFYMTLNEFEDSNNTVLKITESSENILNGNKQEELNSSKDAEQLPDVIQKAEESTTARETSKALPMSPSEKAKEDAQIVLDLLKNSKEFDKLYSKIQKKRSIDKNIHSSKIAETRATNYLPEVPPRPPSRSPPPLEFEIDCPEFNSLTEPPQEEPIYETLLRNVHVPYKFSPVLGRSKSMQYNKTREQKSQVPRPESDYVTLVYTTDGILKHVEDEEVQRPASREPDINTTASSSSSSTMTLKRASIDSEYSTERNLTDFSQQMSASYHGTSDFSPARPHTAKSILKRLWSHSTLTFENPSSVTLFRSVSNLEPRRSDSFEKDRHSILHLQGSETIGERMAHVDYADPRTLFAINKNDQPKQLQRDSVFSFTSSNDSVCDSKPVNPKYFQPKENFDYEDCVEACLENDFRDSAVYSDDNDKRVDKTLPLPLRTSTNPPLKPKPLHVPPSPLVKSPLNRPPPINEASMGATTFRVPGVIMCPPDLSPSSTRSWVLQQIDNFSK